MVHILTEEESKEAQRRHWNALEPGSLFDEGRGLRQFITVKKTEDSLTVIELNPENIQKILQGEKCVTTEYQYDKIIILNLNDSRSRDRACP